MILGKGKASSSKKGLYDKNDREESDESPKSSGWLMSGPDEIRKATDSARMQSNKKRPPEMWIKDGTSVLLRFRSPGPIACIDQYRFKVNGEWVKYTCPGPDEDDLFRDELNLRPSRVWLYDVVDVLGYKNKEGKTATNVPRFLPVGLRLHEQITAVQEESEVPWLKLPMKIRRTGAQKNTSYTVIAQQASPMPQEVRDAEVIADKVEQFYAPPTLKEQRTLVSARLRSGNRDDRD